MQPFTQNLVLVNALPLNDTHPTQGWNNSNGTSFDLDRLKLPNFRKLLKYFRPSSAEKIPALSLNTPFECAIAQLMNWPMQDGLLPFAASKAQELSLLDRQSSSDQGWAFVSLCHWSVQQGQVHLSADAQMLGVSHEESLKLMKGMAGYFHEDGIELFSHPDLKPGQWLALSRHFKDLPCASLELVRGQNLDDYLIGQPHNSQHPSTGTLKRLQNEMQMYLYHHPINDNRSMSINSFWISGCGTLSQNSPETLQHSERAKGIAVYDLLKKDGNHSAAPTLFHSNHELTQFWADQWRALDQRVLEPFTHQGEFNDPNAHLQSITLCSVNQALLLKARAPSWIESLTEFIAPRKIMRYLNT
jgi:hypothetical protein